MDVLLHHTRLFNNGQRFHRHRVTHSYILLRLSTGHVCDTQSRSQCIGQGDDQTEYRYRRMQNSPDTGNAGIRANLWRSVTH